MDGRRGRDDRRGRRVRWGVPAVLGVLVGTSAAVLPLVATSSPAAPRQSTVAQNTPAQTTPDQTTPAGSTPANSDQALDGVLRTAAACPPPRPGYVASSSVRRSARPTVALTFDDGPDAQTGAVLDVLARERVPATFFVIGRKVAPRAAMVRRAVQEGHLVGDHTWEHHYPRDVPGGWTTTFLRRSMSRTNAAVTAASGAPVCWFRPPGGFRPPTELPAARGLRMSTALWSVDSLDWKIQSRPAKTPAEYQSKINNVVRGATAVAGRRHPVVLMHDGGGDRRITVAALPRIIAWYRAHGYTFVRIDGTR